jgi:hypothetical protein
LEEIRNLGEAAFSFKFEGSQLLDNLTQGSLAASSYETYEKTAIEFFIHSRLLN